MATEVELFEYQDLASRPSIRGLVDTAGRAQLTLGSVPVGTYSSAVTGSRALTAADLETLLNCNSATTVTLTIPNDATLALSDASIPVCVAAYQSGAGAVSFAAGSGVTLRGLLPSVAQYGTIAVMRVGANEWAYL